MQSYFQITGYGYRKRVCEDVTTWFLNKFLPRHKIYVEILHRGLKREGVYGYCDYTGEAYRPREFLIELDTWMNKELYIKTLLHELVHLQQWVTGSLRAKRGKRYYNSINVEDIEYWDQPHEIIAREQEVKLYREYLTEMMGMPDHEVAHWFPNRLLRDAIITR
jgi:hypothetical protein